MSARAGRRDVPLALFCRLLHRTVGGDGVRLRRGASPLAAGGGESRRSRFGSRRLDRVPPQAGPVGHGSGLAPRRAPDAGARRAPRPARNGLRRRFRRRPRPRRPRQPRPGGIAPGGGIPRRGTRVHDAAFRRPVRTHPPPGARDLPLRADHAPRALLGASAHTRLADPPDRGSGASPPRRLAVVGVARRIRMGAASPPSGPSAPRGSGGGRVGAPRRDGRPSGRTSQRLRRRRRGRGVHLLRRAPQGAGRIGMARARLRPRLVRGRPHAALGTSVGSPPRSARGTTPGSLARGGRRGGREASLSGGIPLAARRPDRFRASAREPVPSPAPRPERVGVGASRPPGPGPALRGRGDAARSRRSRRPASP